ncbi:M23 family metallopeptidase [Paenibacillus sp. 481]|uniref:M23 family metallopeptidase n=1 Tax=Paenibacillus sp. 481 TaxID=2835869 RepID=UPI001E35A3C8|nr:M23 family metallopeptidase [Paenibacillus sp. 481]UHA75598.1 M23 family metallopeptidase [Paenibacillus sp. 481]
MKKGLVALTLVGLMVGSVSSFASANSGYSWPVPDSKRITQKYGGAHKGIDIGGKRAGVAGDNVVSFYSGSVARAGWSTSYGWVVYVHHKIGSKNIQSRYAHLHLSPVVSVGQAVSSGTKLGIMGNTGQSQGVHLHFETRTCSGACKTDNSSTPFDPLANYFPGYKIAASASNILEADGHSAHHHDHSEVAEEEVFYSMEEINKMTSEERAAKGIPVK